MAEPGLLRTGRMGEAAQELAPGPFAGDDRAVGGLTQEVALGKPSGEAPAWVELVASGEAQACVAQPAANPPGTRRGKPGLNLIVAKQ